MTLGSRNRGNVKCSLSNVLKTGEMLSMLDMLNVFWEIGGGQKGQTFNIFNISRVLATFRKKHLTFPLFRDSRFTKQGKC